jgi:hypothetical protein
MNPLKSAAILNALFKTGGSAGKTPEQEAAQLLEQGVNVDGDYGPLTYAMAYVSDGYEMNGDTAKELDAKKELVNATSWYYTTTVSETRPDPNPEAPSGSTKRFTGWVINKRNQQLTKWPSAAYLALYTTMPDKDGHNFVEPAADTTYIRVDLHKAIISGGVSISEAADGEENYTSITVNTELIATPEVSGKTWGTIVGFGVHEKGTPGPDAPQLWARLKTPVATAVGKVPLFRKNKMVLTFGPMGETDGCTILDGLLGFKKGATISWSGACWLGLLTRPPKADRTAYEDGKFFSEPDDPEYVRVRVDDISRINGKYIISGTEPGEVVAINDSGDQGQPMVVKNQALILMNEITVKTDVVAWGMFRSSDTTSTTKPFLWGGVKDSSGATTITMAPEEIPIVREGGLQISMM